MWSQSPCCRSSLVTSWRRWSVQSCSTLRPFVFFFSHSLPVLLCAQVCGSPDIPLHLLKSVATYKGVEPTSALIQWFWEVMESFSNTERSLFLRFVWGRTRLPRTIADFRGRDFVVQVRRALPKTNPMLPKPLKCNEIKVCVWSNLLSGVWK